MIQITYEAKYLALGRNMPVDLEMLTMLAYSAALDDKKWSIFLRACSDMAGGGVRTCLTGYDLDARIDLGAQQFGYDPDFEKSYIDYYFERDFLAEKMLSAGSGQLVDYSRLWNDPTFRTTEFYNDWVRPQEDITGGSSVLLFKQHRRLFAFSGSIRAKDINHLETPWNRIVQHVTPHLQQAFEIARTLAGSKIEKQALVNVRNPSAVGCLVVTRNRRVIFTNEHAETLIEKGDVIRCNLEQRLSFLDEKCEVQFSAAISKSGALFHEPQTINIYNTDNEPFLTCRIAPLAAEDLEYLPYGILFGNDEPSFLITLAEHSDVLCVTTRLYEKFSLTPNEARVAIHLASGLSPKEIADFRGTSISTVRNQIHAAMSKMNARRQSDVVGIIATMRH
jgi:DNA-binding CsgD family transcriptional regulator